MPVSVVVHVTLEPRKQTLASDDILEVSQRRYLTRSTEQRLVLGFMGVYTISMVK